MSGSARAPKEDRKPGIRLGPNGRLLADAIPEALKGSASDFAGIFDQMFSESEEDRKARERRAYERQYRER